MNINLFVPTPSQTFLSISKSAFDHNIAYYKNIIGPTNTLAVVVKSNGYGHGLSQIGYLCQNNDMVDYVCVASLSEALSLPHMTKPILVLGYNDCSIENAIKKNIHFMVEDLDHAQTINTIGQNHQHTFNVHVKIDTGLSRLGIMPKNALFFITQLQKFKYINVCGIFSHFAASNNNPDFTTYQLKIFNKTLALLSKNNITIPYVHMSNSAALDTINYTHNFNFFRLGLGAYGYGLNASHLKPIMTWKTRVVSIKTIPAHSFIGYACTYKTKKPTRIALIPVGYYDGYDFRFGNKTSVVINGQHAPIIGRVAMNITIIDVTNISVNINDEVILIGDYPTITAQNLAAISEITNVREILTGINPLLTRIIIE